MRDNARHPSNGRSPTGARRILAALALLWLAGPANAQVALLRSGDHSDFTRLTLPLPAGSAFHLDLTSGQGILSLIGSGIEVDASRVYDRIGRDRLANVTVTDGTTVTLDLACDCPIDAEIGAGNLLILDIRDGPSLDNSAANGPAEAPQGISPTIAASTDSDPTDLAQGGGRSATIGTAPALTFGLPPLASRAGDQLPLAEPLPAARRETSARVPISAPDASMPEDTNALATPPPPNLPPVNLPGPSVAKVSVGEALDIIALPDSPTSGAAELTRDLEERLLAAIGSAATEGLLTPDSAAVIDLTDEQRRVIQTPDRGVSPDPGLAATPSSFDSDDLRGRDRIILSGDSCAIHMSPLIAPEGQDFAKAVAQTRAGLSGEFDRDDADAYLRLAHLYLTYGFGAEARHVLEAAPQPPLIAAEMAAIARILDYGHDAENGPFTGRLTCDTDAAFWAALTPEALTPGAPYAAEAIKRTLMEMPDPLKAAVGPLIAERFAVSGDNTFARELLRIIERNLMETSPRQALAAAMLANDEGPPDKADFAPLIAGNSDISPEALLHYTNESLAHSARVDAETIGLLESFRGQYREPPLATELARAETLAHAAAENFPAAFTLYDTEREQFADDTRAELVDTMASGLAALASDPIFARLYFTHAAELSSLTSPETQNQLADRLIGLGLPDVTTPLLDAEAEGATGDVRRLLRARAALAMNLPRNAEAELEGLNTPEANRLRAEARLARDDFASASELFAASGDPEAAEEAAWLARDWDQLQDSDAERARLADVLQQEPRALPDLGPPTLAASRDVLEQSDSTRSALRDLLSSLQVATSETP